MAAETIFERLVRELRTFGDTSAREPQLPAISVPTAELNSLLSTVKQLKQQLDLLTGRSGTVMDKALTLRDLTTAGVMQITLGGTVIGSTPLPGGPVVIGTPANPGLILTVPPTPTDLVVSGAFRTIFVDWELIPYTNHAFVEVFRAAVDNLSLAVKIGQTTTNQFIDTTGIYSVTYFYWVRAVLFDANNNLVEGAFNAVAGTQGGLLQVGNVDLAPLVITADKLSSGSVTAEKTLIDIGGDNLLANNSFEVDSDGNGIADTWAPYNFNPHTNPAWDRVAGRITGFAQRTNWFGACTDGRMAVFSTGGVRGGWKTGTTYVVSFYAYATGGGSGKMQLAWNTFPSLYQEIKNPDLLGPGSWQRYAFRIRWNGAPEPTAGLFIAFLQAPFAAGSLVLDDVQVEEGDQLSGYFGKLATQTIVAGDGAIANLAITNALIANAAIDDAKIANLSAAKLTAGDGTIGNILKSANYVPGSTGWRMTSGGLLDANEVQLRGSINGGAYTGFAWPAGTAGGFHLGPSGLLLGNGNTPRYFQVAANGDIAAPKFSIVNGNATFSGTLSAATGSFAGSLSAATGTFAGSLSAATGTFAGSLSAVSGTFNTVTAGLLRNSPNTARINLNATGSADFIVAGSGAVRITANGDAFFTKILASGTWTGSIPLITTTGGGEEPISFHTPEQVFTIGTGFVTPIHALPSRSFSARISTATATYNNPQEGAGNYAGMIQIKIEPVYQVPMFGVPGENPGQNPFGQGNSHVALRVTAQIIDRDFPLKSSFNLTSLGWTLDAIG